MKNLIIALTCFAVIGCAANPAVYGTTKQNYRPKGEDKTISIESRIVVKKNLIDSNDYAVIFKLEDNLHLAFNLTKNGNGELSCNSEVSNEKDSYMCKPYNGHKIGASCVGSTINGNLSYTQCAFYFDNETAANFKF